MPTTRRGQPNLALDQTIDPFAPYVPRVALEWSTDDATESSHRIVDGSLVFIDVSGFTALSERLARQGRVGAEELTTTLSACFAELLSIAYDAGGSLLKFGGDALLLLFDGEEHARRACSSALAMRAAMATVGRVVTSVGPVRLRMSVGIHSGPLHLFRVGRSHRELIVTGPGATATAEMESIADATQIVIGAGTAACLPKAAVGRPKGAGFLLRDRPIDAPRSPAPPISGVENAAALGVPVALREELRAGRLESEHRRISIAFVHFSGVDALLAHEGPEAVAAALAALVVDVQAAAEEHGVTFLATDVDRDGGKIILVAGAPRALGDDEGRMLRALRCIADVPRTLPVSIGVHRGHAFVGEVGPPFRRTYTVMGDAVNLAARLMASAGDGEIRSTAAVLDSAATEFEAAAVPPFMVKGKSEPVEAFVIGPQIEGSPQRVEVERAPLRGRDDECAALRSALDGARSGRGGLVDIFGESGVGKTRLVQELCDQAGAHGVPVLRSYCEPFEAQTPYFAFRFLLRGLLGIDAGGASGGAALEQSVARVAPELLDWLPLLAGVADVEVPSTDAADKLDPRFRRAATSRAVVELLRACAPTPSLFVIEDGQWMDALSRELVDAVAAAAAGYGWLICVARREDADATSPKGAIAALQVLPLAHDAARAIASDVTADAPLLPAVRDALIAQAGGNPLFLHELLRVQRAGDDGAESLPETLEAVVATQIDSLPPEDRTLLRYAAVLGATFGVPLLSDVTRGEVPTAAAAVRKFGAFVEVVTPGLLRFRNECFRQVAYDALSFGRRRELHARVAEAIERSTATSDAERAASLSLHFLHAQEYERSWRYSRIAGDHARASYANSEAAEMYERALVASRHAPGVEADDLAVVWESLGDVSLLVGWFDRATAAYGRARALRGGDRDALAFLCMKQSRTRMHQGKTENALRWIRRGLQVLEGAEDRGALTRRAQLHTMYANNRQVAGRPRQALRWSTLAIEEAERARQDQVLASALVVHDWALVALGRAADATHLPRALEIFEESGDAARAAEVLMYLGLFAYTEGRWPDAIERWSQARAAYLGAGNVVDAAHGASNSAEILIHQGRYDEAESLVRDALEVWRAADYPAVADALSHQGKIALGRGDVAGATRLFEEVALLASAGGASVPENDGWLAECLLRSGLATDALDRIDAALKSEASAGDGTFLPMLHRLRGYACEALGQIEAADAELARSIAIARERGAAYEIALTLSAIDAIAVRRGEPVPEGVADESEAIRRRLGIDALPSPPLP
ncbi:MAG TPA: adenylate/guanylate cyclase domain-containing protein [Acidimicrobiia bacterium]|nr:adenylate/guanylate cyclase domain-containing protein [Acidimicrobiia bacterium]